MFRTSIWSISPPSKRSPGLSGAIRGWSSRMIGEDSSVRGRRVADEHRPRPAFSHASACARSVGGGSVSDTNAPPPVRSTVWVEQNVRASASSRSPPSHGVVFAIVTDSRQSALSRRSAPTSTAPSSACQVRIERAAAAPSAWRRSSRSEPASTRRRAPPHTPIDRPRRRDDLALDRLVPGDVALAARPRARRRARARRPRRARRVARTTCRKRTRTSTVASGAALEQAPRVRIVHGVVGMRGAVRRAGRRRRTSSAAGSSAPSAGRARGCSPRRGRRRRSRAGVVGHRAPPARSSSSSTASHVGSACRDL